MKVYESAAACAVTDGLDARSKAVPVRLTVPLAAPADRPLRLSGEPAEPGSEKVAFSRTPIVIVQ